MVILDMETNGLLPHCTKVHCAVAYNIARDNYIKFTPDKIHLLPDYLDSIPQLCMHNGIGFDFKVLKKLFNYEYKGYYVDTLLLSRILWPDIEPAKYISGYDDEGEPIYKSIKGHSVEAWGARFDILKPDHENWDEYSEEMLHRCTEDVRIQTKIYLKCLDTINKYKSKDNRLNNWNNIITLEQDFWKGMEIQADNGWQLDVDKTKYHSDFLESEMDKIDKQLDDILPPVLIKPYKDSVCTAFKKDGTMTSIADNWFVKNFRNLPLYFKGTIAGDFCRVKFEPLNLNSPEQLKNFLLKEGWVPREYNYKKDQHGKPIKDAKGNLLVTSPKTPKTLEDWEQTAAEMSSPSIKLLANRNKLKHRYGMMKGFLEKVRPDRRIEAKMISCGCPTMRARHIDVVNIPKAEEQVFFGKECRSVFTVPEGKVLVGGDAVALEARCEAHYLYKIDKAAADVLINADIHTFNAEVWGVIRQLAKNGKYALTYGCSPNKLAATLLKPTEMARQLYEDFWIANPALKELVDRLEQQHKAKGYLVAIDGRPLSIRYDHARLNTLLQSAGAIVMKKAWCLFDAWRKKEKLEKVALDVGNFHDELQVETLPEFGDIIGKEIVKSIELAGEILKFNISLTGDYKIGVNWSETH